uniref:Secreted protein n=1 Tax=uncultured organism TaxID=155900 RepID=M1P165_9ZZZZ|nr:secreted protein [uncultured organism]
MKKVRFALLAFLILGLVFTLSGCASNTSDSENASDSSSGISNSCEEAFEEAASVSAYQDTNEDMNPAFRECNSIEEFKKASEKYPDALDGTAPESYIQTRCMVASEELGDTPICKAWDEK